MGELLAPPLLRKKLRLITYLSVRPVSSNASDQLSGIRKNGQQSLTYERLLQQPCLHLLLLVVSVAAWAAWTVLATIGMFWHPLHATLAVICLLAMAVGCFANAFKNRTDHCVLTGPLFLIAVVLLLSSDLTHIKPASLGVVLVGTGIAFLLEWRYSRKLRGAVGS